MAVDYDVVIIGGSLAGRYAAIYAARLRAIVALVEPEDRRQETIQNSERHSPLIATHTLAQIGQLKQQLTNTSQFGFHCHQQDATKSCLSLQLHAAMRWAEGAIANLEEQDSPAVLAALGVDFIRGNGHFESGSHLTFTVNKRRLLARSYIIATNARPAIPDIEGLQSSGYLTPARVWQAIAAQTPPQRWLILGSDPTGCQLAQSLAQLGFDVTLIVKRSRILPQEDPEIAHLLQAVLEAEGVRVLTETAIAQVKQIDGKKWVQAGNEAMEFDEILLSAGQPDFEALNLEAVGVKLKRNRLVLNKKLQTTNHRIYACGDAIGGYQFNHIANYEARIAIKNALFFPLFKVDYRSIPWVIFSQPQLARVGLTEAQAKQRYGSSVLVLQQYFKTIAAAHIRDELSGICKLVVLHDGTILGAAIVGSQAGELINSISLAIAQRLKVDAIAHLAPIYPSYSEILQHTAAEYHQVKFSNNHRWQNVLASFFSFRRSSY